METVTKNGVTYTPKSDNAALTYDSSGNVTGISSGTVEVTPENSTDPKITLDGSTAFNFTAEAQDDSLKIVKDSSSFIYTSGQATYSADKINFPAGNIGLKFSNSMFSSILGTLNIAVPANGLDLPLNASGAVTFNLPETLTATVSGGTATGSISLGGTITYDAENKSATLAKDAAVSVNNLKLTEDATALNFAITALDDSTLAIEGLYLVFKDGASINASGNALGLTGDLSVSGGDLSIAVLNLITGTSSEFTLSAGATLTTNMQGIPVSISSPAESSSTMVVEDGIFSLMTDDKNGTNITIGNLTALPINIKGTMNFDIANNALTLTKGTVAKITLPNGSVMQVTANDDATSKFDIAADGTISLTPNEGDGTLNVKVLRPASTVKLLTASNDSDSAEETVLDLDFEVVSGSLSFNPSTYHLGVEAGTVIKAVMGNYTFTISNTEDAGGTLSFTESGGITYTPDTNDGGLTINVEGTGDSQFENVVLSALNGSFTWNADNTISVAKDTEFKLTFSDEYSISFKATDEAGGNIALVDSGITYTPAEGDGNLELTVTNGETTRKASLEVTGTVTYTLGGNISLAQGTVVKNVFEDGNTLTITANKDADGAIYFNPEGGLTITPASSDALSVVLTNGDITILDITSITGSISYQGGVVTASDGSEIRFTNYFMDSEMLLSTNGGTSSMKFTEDSISYTANEGATLALDYQDGTTVQLQNGTITDNYESGTLTAGSVLKANDTEQIFELETAGTYTLNGNEITTTEDGVQVILSNYDTVTFDASEGVTFDGKTFDGEGTVSITDGAISLGEGAYIAGETNEEPITSDGLIYTPVGSNTVLIYDTEGNVTGISSGAVEITQENSDSPKITVDGSTRCNFTAEAASDGIKMNVESGKVTYTVTEDNSSRAVDFEVEGSVIFGADGNISPLEGAVLTETFEDGNTLNVTANSDATNAINFPAENSLQFEPANSDDLTLDLIFSNNRSMIVDTIEGAVSYTEDTIALSEGSSVSGEILRDELQIPFAFDVEGGTGYSKVQSEKMVYTVSDGATLNAVNGNNEISMTAGTVTLALETDTTKIYLAEGTVMKGNSQNPVILETAGSYNMNGEQFTSTADNVVVYLTNFNTVEFESDAAIIYNGHTFDGKGNVKIVDGVLYFTMTEAGVLNLDERIFNLTENVPQGTTISLIEGGFQVSRVLSEEEVAANNWDPSDAGKTFSEVVEIANDDSYTIDLVAKGIDQIFGISNGAIVKTYAVFDGEPDKNNFTISTDEVGTITAGDRTYEISGDTNITFNSEYYTDETSKIRYVEKFDEPGEMVGNFSGISSINGDTVSIVSGADNASVINDGTNLSILGVDSGSSVSLGGDNVFVQVTDSMTINDVTYQVSGDSDGVLVSNKNITGLDENASLTISAAGTYKINGTEFTTEKDGTTISLTAEDTFEFELEDGLKATITANTDDAGTILINEDGSITITPSAADSMNVSAVFNKGVSGSSNNIDGSITLSGDKITFADGTKIEFTWAFGEMEEIANVSVTGGSASIEITDDTIIYTPDEGATFTSNFTNNETFTISDGSILINREDLSATISEGTVVTNANYEKAFTLEKAGTYSLNGKEITTTKDGVQVYLNNDDISFVMTEIGDVTVDGKTFTLNGDAPNGVTVKPTDSGFELSHVVTAEEVAKYADLFGVTESDIGKTFTETVTISNDDTYTVELVSTGLSVITGISDQAVVKASATLDGETLAGGTPFNIITDSTGTITFNDKSYTINGDNQVGFYGHFANESFAIRDLGLLDNGGTVSGDFNDIASLSGSTITISDGADNASITAVESFKIISGVKDGASITAENTAVEVQNSMTVNDVTYKVNGDADGVLVADKNIAGLDANASLTVSEAGNYTVNTTPLEVTESDTIVALNENYAYINNAESKINSNSTTEEILDAMGVAESDAVVVPATAADEQRATLGNDGEVAVVEATETPVTITGGSGDDTLITKGDNVKFNMGYGGTDKVIALGGNVTLQNYDPRGDSGLQLTAEDIKEGVKFGDNTIELANATVSMNDNFVNLYDLSGNKSQVGFATSDDKLVDASGVTDGVSLLAGGENVTNSVSRATLIGGSGNDSISGGEKSQIKPGAGNDFVEMSSLGGSTVNYTSGNDSISGLNFAGGSVAADTIRATVTDSSVSGGNVILTTATGTITVEDAENKDIVIGSEIWQVGNNLDFDGVATKYFAKGTEASLNADNFEGDKAAISLDSIEGDVKYVDASGYEGAASITGNDNDNVITASEGGSTLNGGGGNNSLKGGSGADEFISESGENTIANFEFGTGDTADKLNTGAQAVSGVKVSGDDIILKYEDGSAKVEGASGQIMQLQNERTNNTPILAQFADDTLAVNDTATFYWAGGKNAVVIVGNSLDSTAAVTADLSNADFNNSDELSFYGDIKELDASGFAGAAELTGNSKHNIITASEGGSTLNGGGGNNSLKGGSGTDEFISESGKNTIANFEFGEGNDKLNLGAQAVKGVNVSGDDVILKYEDGLAKVEGGAGKTIQLENEHTDGTILAQFAKDSLTVNDEANFYWASGKNATVKVGDYSGNVEIDLTNADFNNSEQLAFYGDIKEVDASGYNGYTEITGNDKNNVLKAGNNGSALWGGDSGNDTLIGGDGTDIFIYKKGNGDDVIQNIDNSDLINFEGLTLDDISNIECTDSSIKFKFSDGGSVKVETDAPESVQFAPDDGTAYTYTYNKTTGGFNAQTQGSW